MPRQVLHERARIASLTRSRTPDDPELVAARLNFHAAKLEEAIRRTVDDAPDLSIERRARLAALLMAGGDRRATSG